MKKRVYLILVNENLFHPYYFAGIIKQIHNGTHKICGVSIVADVHKKGYFNFLRRQLTLWGLLGFLIIGIHSTLRKMLDFLALGDLSIKSIAKKHHIPVLFCMDVNSPKHLKKLKSMKIDIIISSNGQIFKHDLLVLPKISCINRHTALLPRYGGVLPVFWAMLNNEKEFGVSVHYMTEKIDQGEVIYQIPIPLRRDHSLFFNYILGFIKSIDCTINALNCLENGKRGIIFYHNDKEYFSFPKDKDIVKFHSNWQSFSLFDTISFYKLFSQI